jgi:hypothetical protein
MHRALERLVPVEGARSSARFLERFHGTTATKNIEQRGAAFQL